MGGGVEVQKPSSIIVLATTFYLAIDIALQANVLHIGLARHLVSEAISGSKHQGDTIVVGVPITLADWRPAIQNSAGFLPNFTVVPLFSVSAHDRVFLGPSKLESSWVFITETFAGRPSFVIVINHFVV